MIGRCAAVVTFAATVFSGPVYADVTISSDATNNMSCSNGVCSPTASNAVLNVSDLQSLLTSGNVRVTTTGSGGVQATNINVSAALSWSSQSTLGLDAYESVVVQKKISVPTGAGLSLTTNDGGSGGELWIVNGGRVVFRSLSSALSINGTSFTLVKTIAALARMIAKNPSGAYALANDYDASVDGTYSASPVSTDFLGTFEGLGNTISNLSIATTGSQHNHPPTGFFSGAGSAGVIENLRLAKISVKSSNTRHGVSSTGGLVGDSADTLFNDSVSGRVSAAEGATVGGLVGGTDRDIIASHSSARVTGAKTAMSEGLSVHWVVAKLSIRTPRALCPVSTSRAAWSVRITPQFQAALPRAMFLPDLRAADL